MKSNFKKIILWSLISFTISCSYNSGERINYVESSLETAFEKAKELNKHLLVLTAFTDKKEESDNLIAKIESDKEIIAELNTHFVVYKCELPKETDSNYKWAFSTVPKPMGYIFAPNGKLLDFINLESHTSIIALTLKVERAEGSKYLEQIKPTVIYYNEILLATKLIENNVKSLEMESLYKTMINRKEYYFYRKENYFYYNYMLSKMANILNKKNEAILYAQRGLLNAEEKSMYLFKELFEELGGSTVAEEISNTENNSYKRDGVTLLEGKICDAEIKEITLNNPYNRSIKNEIKIKINTDRTFSYRLENPNMEVAYQFSIATFDPYDGWSSVPFFPDSDKISFKLFSHENYEKTEISGSALSEKYIGIEREIMGNYLSQSKEIQNQLTPLWESGQRESKKAQEILIKNELMFKKFCNERLSFIEKDMTLVGYSMLMQFFHSKIGFIRFQEEGMIELGKRMEELQRLYKFKYPNHPYTKHSDKVLVEVKLDIINGVKSSDYGLIRPSSKK